MITKKSRILFHAEFRVLGFDKSTGLTTIKPRFLEYNADLDRFYHKRLKIMYAVPGKKAFIKKKLNKWYVEKASKDILEVYEKFKKKYTDDLNKQLLNEIIEGEKEEETDKKSKDFMKLYELYQQYGENYVKILSEMPHMTPYSVENYLKFIKRGTKGKVPLSIST